MKQFFLEEVGKAGVIVVDENRTNINQILTNTELCAEINENQITKVLQNIKKNVIQISIVTYGKWSRFRDKL